MESPDPPPYIDFETLAEAEREFIEEVTYDSDFFDNLCAELSHAVSELYRPFLY